LQKSLSRLVMVFVPWLGRNECQNLAEYLDSIYAQLGVLRLPHFSVLMCQELCYGVSSKGPIMISSASNSIELMRNIV
jgi:hypothetical protein